MHLRSSLKVYYHMQKDFHWCDVDVLCARYLFAISHERASLCLEEWVVFITKVCVWELSNVWQYHPWCVIYYHTAASFKTTDARFKPHTQPTWKLLKRLRWFCTVIFIDRSIMISVTSLKIQICFHKEKIIFHLLTIKLFQTCAFLFSEEEILKNVKNKT